jgi:hypothetical protein
LAEIHIDQRVDPTGGSAMAARFDKPDTGPFGVIDGFDAGALYQMVPVGESRLMAVVTDGRGGRLRVGTPQFASLRNARSTKPFDGAQPPFQINLPPDSKTTFEIFGDTSGRTSLVFEDNVGKEIATLTVSIKIKFKRTYNYCLVSDIRRSSSFVREDVPRIFAKAAQTFLQQANLVLAEHTPLGFDVNVLKNLGNPLQVENRKVTDAIIGATPRGAFAADFVVYLCWNIVTPGSDVGGVAFTGTQVCFCEDNGHGSKWGTPLVVAHELGHLMGLDHFESGGLMQGKVFPRSSLLFQFEIDTVNPT